MFGASVTIGPAVMTPECPAWGSQGAAVEADEAAVAAAEVLPFAEVSAWLEGLYEPLVARELVDVTGASYEVVAKTLRVMRHRGQVARQETGGEPLWLWRRGPH